MYMHLPICICIYIRIDKHDEDPLYYAPFLDADLLYMNAESDLLASATLEACGLRSRSKASVTES